MLAVTRLGRSSLCSAIVRSRVDAKLGAPCLKVAWLSVAVYGEGRPLTRCAEHAPRLLAEAVAAALQDARESLRRPAAMGWTR